METDWRKTITSDPEVLLGKPVVKGTRLSVEFILGLFAAGWTESKVLEEYPNLTDADIRAIFAFATECMREESLDMTIHLAQASAAAAPPAAPARGSA